MVEIISWYLRVLSIFSFSSTFIIFVAKNEVKNDATIPKALINKG
jgi:hypothetical protein